SVALREYVIELTTVFAKKIRGEQCKAAARGRTENKIEVAIRRMTNLHTVEDPARDQGQVETSCEALDGADVGAALDQVAYAQARSWRLGSRGDCSRG